MWKYLRNRVELILHRMDGIAQLERTRVFTQQETWLVASWKWSKERKKRLWIESTAVFLRTFAFLRFSGICFSSLSARSTKNFNAKNFCDRRQYEYILPIETLSPFQSTPPLSIREDIFHSWNEFIENEAYLQKCREHPDSTNENPFEDRPDNKQRVKSLQIAQQLLSNETSFSNYTEDAQDRSFGGCVSKEEWPAYLALALSRLRACMSLFVGTHNFHNYTVGKSSADTSAQRHILGISVSDPIRIHDSLYIRVCLEGQSFMLHQIRKMIGISIEVARGRCSLHTVNSSLSRGNMFTPMAPSTGLFLSMVAYANFICCSLFLLNTTKSKVTKHEWSISIVKMFKGYDATLQKHKFMSISMNKSKRNMYSLHGSHQTIV